MAEPLLAIQGLQSGYGDVQVLWDASLTVEAGSIACLVGSNGAGKTTLMRTLSGLIRARAGTVRFNGADLTAATPEAVLTAGIAHVPEGRRLFSAMPSATERRRALHARGRAGCCHRARTR